jgi:putative membrane protein
MYASMHRFALERRRAVVQYERFTFRIQRLTRMHSIFTFLRNALVLAAGVFLAALLVPGIEYDDNWSVLAKVVLVLALFNLVIKPILVLFALPFIMITLGIGLWLINAAILYWVGRLVEGFSVSSFWAALGGALVISVANMMLSGFARVQRPPRRGPPRSNTPPPTKVDGEVIDV